MFNQLAVDVVGKYSLSAHFFHGDTVTLSARIIFDVPLFSSDNISCSSTTLPVQLSTFFATIAADSAGSASQQRGIRAFGPGALHGKISRVEEAQSGIGCRIVQQ